MGKFPVISISLKSVNGMDFATARSLMCSTIGNEAMRFYCCWTVKKSPVKKKQCTGNWLRLFQISQIISICLNCLQESKITKYQLWSRGVEALRLFLSFDISISKNHFRIHKINQFIFSICEACSGLFLIQYFK